jgi:hypothetical protein
MDATAKEKGNAVEENCDVREGNTEQAKCVDPEVRTIVEALLGAPNLSKAAMERVCARTEYAIRAGAPLTFQWPEKKMPVGFEDPGFVSDSSEVADPEDEDPEDGNDSKDSERFGAVLAACAEGSITPAATKAMTTSPSDSEAAFSFDSMKRTIDSLE